MLQLPAALFSGLVVAAKAVVTKAAAATAAAAAGAKAAAVLKVTIGALSFVIAPIFILNYKTVEQHARGSSDEKVKLRRAKVVDQDGKDYILVVLEARGKKPVAWLTEKLDKLLAEILPHDGAEATI